MSQVDETIRAHHKQLLVTLADHVTALVAGQPDADLDGLVHFLKGDLLPHAVGEERHLYPAMEPLIKAHGQATATMGVDHEFIEAYIEEIEDTVQAARSAGEDTTERRMLLGRLQRLALQLDAVLRMHLEKEERIYLPLFERYLAADERQRILEGMHEPYDPAARGSAGGDGAVEARRQAARVLLKQSASCCDESD